MPKNFSRTQRINDAVHRILARTIQEEFKDPRVGMITISSVHVSPDLKYAKVYVSVLEEDKVKETLTILNGAAGFFRSQIAAGLKLRVVPRPRFIYDDSMLKGTRIETLLRKAGLDDE